MTEIPFVTFSELDLRISSCLVSSYQKSPQLPHILYALLKRLKRLFKYHELQNPVFFS